MLSKKLRGGVRQGGQGRNESILNRLFSQFLKRWIFKARRGKKGKMKGVFFRGRRVKKSEEQ